MRKKHDKTVILDQGIELLSKKGYHNTGVDDILKKCKIPSGSFYNFFKNKEGFAIQALERYSEIYREHLKKVLTDPERSPLERLERLFSSSVQDHLANDCSKGCLLNSMTSEVAALNLAIGKSAAHHYLANSQIIARAIEEGQKQGEIRNDFSASELAFFMIDGFSGATTRMQAGQSGQPLNLFLKTVFTFIRPPVETSRV